MEFTRRGPLQALLGSGGDNNSRHLNSARSSSLDRRPNERKHNQFERQYICSGPGENRVGSNKRGGKPTNDSTGHENVVVVEWAAVEYLCTEDDEEVVLSILRRDLAASNDPGSGETAATAAAADSTANSRVEVAYRTKNVNVDGDCFVAQQGTVVFEPGEVRKNVSVKIVNNPQWNVEALFHVELSFTAADDDDDDDNDDDDSTSNIHQKGGDDDGSSSSQQQKGGDRGSSKSSKSSSSSSSSKSSRNSQSGGGGGSGAVFLGDPVLCRVFILNTESFPQNVKNIEDVPHVVKGFLVHILSMFPNEAKWGFFWKLAGGLSFLMNAQVTFLLYFAIEQATSEREQVGGGEDYTHSAATRLLIAYFGISYFLIYLFHSFCALRFENLGLGGKARKLLRTSAMHVVLQLTPKEQENYPPGRVVKAVESQVDEALSGFFELFSFAENAFKLLCQIGYVFYLAAEQYISGGTSNLIILLFFTCQPFVMLAAEAVLQWAVLRKSFQLEASAMECEGAFSSFVIEMNILRQLVTNYRKGFKVADAFAELNTVLNQAAFEASLFNLKVSLASTSVPKLSEALVAALLGNQVATGELDFASFVVFLGTIRGFGPTISNLFASSCAIGKSYVGIKALATLLNSETKREMLLKSKKRRKGLIETYDRHHQKSPPLEEPDAVTLHEVAIQFGEVTTGRPTMPTITCVIEPNQLVVVKGGGSTGKSVLLRLIARHFIPSKGFINYPDTWRVRYLDTTCGFFGENYRDSKGGCLELEHNIGTMNSNLHFGEQEFTHSDEDVFALLQTLGATEELIGANVYDFALSDNPCKYRIVGHNAERLSLTDRILLHLARALLSSVDLLIISNVLDMLPLDIATKVLGVLRELATTKGLKCLEAEDAKSPRNLRKSKLVLYATKDKTLEQLANGWIALGD